MTRFRARRLLSVALAAVLVATIGPPTARAAGPEQITNGGFDNGLTGPDGPENATLVTDATAPKLWVLRNGAGHIVRTGLTKPTVSTRAPG